MGAAVSTAGAPGTKVELRTDLPKSQNPFVNMIYGPLRSILFFYGFPFAYGCRSVCYFCDSCSSYVCLLVGYFLRNQADGTALPSDFVAAVAKLSTVEQALFCSSFRLKTNSCYLLACDFT
jgi:hypothetical protein